MSDQPILFGTKLAEEALPKHVAIIMDGNHRWAKKRRLPGAAGHRAGAKNVRPIAELCADLGVDSLTLFAFSTENWNRPQPEIDLLMDLMRAVFRNDLDELSQRGVRLRIIGKRERFPEDLQEQMTDAEALTANNTKMSLNIAANFGGRWDIANAAKKLAFMVKEGNIRPEDIDEDSFSRHLSLEGMVRPDICIRTGGDHRLSNFLLWDMAYTELFFTECFWPDFDEEMLNVAFDWFYERKRRFGKRS
ncbi:MAG: di-trans,poly-cis-decaprenylcistransferase [Gammaproteobacteria bacterium]|nr:di-trans,poly-cis-decaprenylcistransferase [Gammaproteobacteria bacterium]